MKLLKKLYGVFKSNQMHPMQIVKHRWKHCLGWMHGWMHGWIVHFWCHNGVFLCIPFDQLNMMKLTYPLIYLLKIKFRLIILLSKIIV